ncbi:MAG: hypothetical protein NXI22_21415 [bacterium]|nr:hypothetical protein [bacterium]
MTQSPQHTGYRETIYIGPPPPAPRNSLGTAGFLISLFSPLTLGLISPLGLFLSLIALRKQPRGMAGAGVILGGLGTSAILLVGSMVIGGMRHDRFMRDQHHAQRSIHKAEQLIDEYRADFGIMPAGVEGNKKLIVAEVVDPWGEFLSYERESDGYRVRSGGPDRQFGTADDIESKFHRVLKSEIPVIAERGDA